MSNVFNQTFPFVTEEHEMIRETIRRFIADRVIPNGDQWEEDGMIPREILREMAELGLYGITFPEEIGGAGLDSIANVIYAEELGRSTFGGFAITSLVHTDMASPHLRHAGNDEQIARWMPDILAGKKITAIAMTEPDAGSDLAGMRSRAVKVDGGWTLNGAKTFITNGVHADLVFVAAKTGDQGRNHQITMFALEKGMKGFSVARPLHKTGWLSSDTAELHFDDVFVPDENVIGDVGRGFYALVKNLQTERMAICAMCMGEATKAIELTLDWVKQRKAFGEPLWEKQAIRQRLSKRIAEVEAARAMLYLTAWRDSQGEELAKEVSMLKALCGDLVNDVLYDCVQFHGGMGYMRETPVERMSRDVRVQPIGGGASEIMLNEVAKRV